MFGFTIFWIENNKDDTMIKLQILTSKSFVHCAEAKEILKEIRPDFPELEIEEIDMAAKQGQEMINKYMIMSSPGIIINDELFSVGGVKKDKLIVKLRELKM